MCGCCGGLRKGGKGWSELGWDGVVTVRLDGVGWGWGVVCGVWCVVCGVVGCCVGV